MAECVHDWAEIDGTYALTKVEKKGDKISFLPSVGIPVIVRVCKKCGEIKLFSAKKTEVLKWR